MSTTTEPRTEVVTAAFKRALRHADSIAFRLFEGQASIEANREARHTTTGFDEKHVLDVGGVYVNDHDDRHTYVPQDQLHRYRGFYLAGSGIFSPKIRTLIDRLRAGGRIELHWIRSNNSPLSRELGFVRDELYLHVWQPTSGSREEQRQPDVYLVEVACTKDNSARMVQFQ